MDNNTIEAMVRGSAQFIFTVEFPSQDFRHYSTMPPFQKLLEYISAYNSFQTSLV